jgi:hypothetical protein
MIGQTSPSAEYRRGVVEFVLRRDPAKDGSSKSERSGESPVGIGSNGCEVALRK